MKKRIILYGAGLAALALTVSVLRYHHFIRPFSVELLIAGVAILFTGLGIWVGSKLTTGKARPEREFKANERAIDYLGITERELDVLDLIAKGHSNQDIADELFVSVHTVKTHVSNLLSKMDAERRTQAVRKARMLRIIR